MTIATGRMYAEGEIEKGGNWAKMTGIKPRARGGVVEHEGDRQRRGCLLTGLGDLPPGGIY